ATSARCRSAACRVFFEGDVVSVEKPPERAAAGFDPPLAQLCNRLNQGQVRLFGNQSQNLGGELFQRRSTSAARHRYSDPALAPALQPLYGRTHAHLKTLGRLVSRCACLHSFDNAFPQVTRIGLRHRQPPTRRINAQRIAQPYPLGNPPDSNRKGTALGTELSRTNLEART